VRQFGLGWGAIAFFFYYVRRAFLMGLAAALPAADASSAHRVGIALDVIPRCSLPVGVVSHSDQKEIPAVLRGALKKRSLEVPGTARVRIYSNFKHRFAARVRTCGPGRIKRS
jgi:hypothetical protein